jgi:integrase/recombinase XerD
MLREAILDYMRWVKSVEDARGSRSSLRYTRILIDFLIYVIHNDIAWKEMFTSDMAEAFRSYSGYKGSSRAIKALSDYLLSQGRIDQPMAIPKPQAHLPDIYENYLLYHEQMLQVGSNHLRQVRRVIATFHAYLNRHHIVLSALNIEHLDAFMGEFDSALSTRRVYRSCLRGFLKYLYHEKEIIRKDLAPLLIGPPLFARSTLPKCLRPQQVQKLFASLSLATPTDMRTYAMVHLAYSLGLRPVEISRITLDTISFSEGELTVKDRKGQNPITLPIPEQTVKAIAVYLDKGRPKSPSRNLLLTHHFPFRPVSSHTVVLYISKAMKAAGLPSTAYWLRHTYAQNLLHMGQSIYEVKEMLGHQNIQSTQAYLHIHTELMRKVLFNEEL